MSHNNKNNDDQDDNTIKIVKRRKNNNNNNNNKQNSTNSSRLAKKQTKMISSTSITADRSNSNKRNIKDDDDDDNLEEKDEYSLPWSIICKILEQLWIESSVCTCYYSHQLFESTMRNDQVGCFDLLQMWPLYQSVLDVHKESRMKCPMHRYHYLNSDKCQSISISIGTPFTSTINDKNKWRYQLLSISKRVHQLLSSSSSKHFDNVSLILGQEDMWNHIDSQYCPIKTPKKLELTAFNPSLDFPNRRIPLFSCVEKLSFHGTTGAQRDVNTLYSLFQGITSMTINNYGFKSSFILKFKNLTSINIQRISPHSNRQEFLDALVTTGQRLVKLLLPVDWIRSSVTLNTNLASTIQSSNIYPPTQMPNLRTFHLPPDYNQQLSLSFNHPTVTKLVVDSVGIPIIKNQLASLGVNIEILKLTSTEYSHIMMFSKECQRLNVKKLIIGTTSEIYDVILNHFKRGGYQYRGASFQGSTSARKLCFIKMLDGPNEEEEEEEIEIKTLTVADDDSNSISPNSSSSSNSTLPFYLIEKIARYSWNSYLCSCEFEGCDILPARPNLTQIEEPARLFLEAKSKCPTHKDSVPSLETYSSGYLLYRINQRRFGIPMSCKRLFTFVSKHLIKRVAYHDILTGIATYHQHFSNPYCLVGKSIEKLTIEIPNNNDAINVQRFNHLNRERLIDNTRQRWRFIDIDHYSKLQSLLLLPSSNMYTFGTLNYADELFQSIVGRLHQSLTSLDISEWRLDVQGSKAIEMLKNIPLRKLYYLDIENQFLFPSDGNNDGDDGGGEPKGWPLSQSLESVSINSLSVIPKLGNLPKLRHLRIILNYPSSYLQPPLSDEQFKLTLPSKITKLSFTDPNIAKISKHNTQVTELVVLQR
ncbi:hypothetical protein DFA_01774 [Cavenderia fasciculata]|uniref:Uncharacterized protein n=1 Tax=Cavenderia fasciculata TaxID=261658 RepID=F4PUM4_CACFS|nr:uncharacterized protein DFA_01774 [Cavenderia fasciculata]EGG21888.1 hypothetical protein DFA_01774 [Cavenderia fasciculata]|eukprot:XP_004359739.1 hypothetical protein DFA_01774 [Cavenderia fasciculata]